MVSHFVRGEFVFYSPCRSHARAVYKKLRNHVTNLCRDAKKTYFHDNINAAAGNSNDMWGVLRNLLPKCAPILLPKSSLHSHLSQCPFDQREPSITLTSDIVTPHILLHYLSQYLFCTIYTYNCCGGHMGSVRFAVKS